VENPTAYRTDKNIIKAYMSTDNIFDTQDIPLDTLTLWPVQPGDSIVKYFDFQVPSVADGNYFILFVADPGNTMYEDDETNNVAYASFVVGTTAVQENVFSENLAVYPNPTRDYLYFETKNNMRIRKITVHDITGRLIFTERSPSGRIYTGHLEKALYIFDFEDESGLHAVYKIMKR
jgi:hypothetical protein